MRRTLDNGYELDDDPARIDEGVVCAYLGEIAYWSKGREREMIVKTIREADRVVGLYDREGAMAGYCRVVSDDVVFAYLCDVFVLEDHRGRGLGIEIVREAVDNGPHAGLRWLLGTRDAGDFYRRFGFDRPSDLIMERPAAGGLQWE